MRCAPARTIRIRRVTRHGSALGLRLRTLRQERQRASARYSSERSKQLAPVMIYSVLRFCSDALLLSGMFVDHAVLLLALCDVRT